MDTGAPIVGAEVRPYEETNVLRVYESRDAKPSAFTQDDGWFELPVGPGELSLRVDLEDGRIHTEPVFVVPENGAVPERIIRVGDFGRIAGVVRDSTGNGLAGRSVQLRWFAFGDSRELSSVSDATGHFAFERLNRGGHYVSLLGEGVDEELAVMTRRAFVRAGETSEVVLQPTGSATVTGRIEAPVKLPERVRVSAAPKDRPRRSSEKDGLTSRAVFSTDGTFRLEGLPAGDWTLEAYCWSDRLLYVGQVSLAVTEGSTHDVRLELALEED